MYVKFIQDHYDIPSEDGYYLLKLNNNIYEDNFNFKDINELLPVKGYHMVCNKSREVTSNPIFNYLKNPLNTYDDYKNNVFLYKYRRSTWIPIIGELKDNNMQDVITGTTYLYDSSNEINNFITYSKCIKISSEIVKQVLKNLTIEDVNKYATCILSLKVRINKQTKKVK